MVVATRSRETALKIAGLSRVQARRWIDPGPSRMDRARRRERPSGCQKWGWLLQANVMGALGPVPLNFYFGDRACALPPRFHLLRRLAVSIEALAIEALASGLWPILH